MAWLGLYGFAWTDYEVEARAPLHALVHGHVTEFLRLAPVYGGSLVLRAPFVLLANLWGGGDLAVYRLLALPCLLAAVALGVWLAGEMRRRGRPPLARGLALALCVANPLTLAALEVGHPEELLGGALCVAAVLLAARGQTLWAGVLLGTAIANKEWALLALAPVLLVLPSRRALCLLSAAAVAGAVLAPLALVHTGNFIAETRATASTSSSIFQPWQVWWFLGHHGAVVHGTFGRIKPGYRTAPGWIGGLSHPLVLAFALPLTGALWWRRTRQAARAEDVQEESFAMRERQALLLLALLLLARCMLDTWDTVYYAIPFLLALTAWEALGPRGLPVLALAATALAWIDFEWLRVHASADAQAGLFLAWAPPLAVGLALALYRPGTFGARGTPGRLRAVLTRELTRRRSAPWRAPRPAPRARPR
ncbi:MAG TPA: glycosyltransferase 87 family protein [Solirubrobacteraceae bacterium]